MYNNKEALRLRKQAKKKNVKHKFDLKCAQVSRAPKLVAERKYFPPLKKSAFIQT